eukprot:XP_016663506.1 PREDICTED: uncharacterized protein LOC103310578 [Acyrthosiphon pisum]
MLFGSMGSSCTKSRCYPFLPKKTGKKLLLNLNRNGILEIVLVPLMENIMFINDGGVFKDSLIGKGLLNNTLQLPCPTKLSSSTDLHPYCLVGDEAFPLKNLNRARRTIENTFGLLAARWRIFRKPIIASEKTVHAIIQATVVLHNYVISNEKLKGTDNYCQSVHDNQLTTRQER